MQYTLTKRDDVDEVFNYTDNAQDVLEKFGHREVMHYRIKTIKSGIYCESEIYPVWHTRSAIKRLSRFRKSRDVQQRLNQKNSLKHFIRLINTNFKDGDIWGTQTYAPDKLPATVEDAQKEMIKFMRRLKYYAKKHYNKDIKYAYVTEFEDDPAKGKKRVHHHYVTDFPDRDIAEKLWRNGARTQTRRLQADENGYEGMVRYILKDPRGNKRYVTSQNLLKPQITIADTKISKKQVWDVINGVTTLKQLMNKIYTNHNYTTGFVHLSEFVTGAYIYAKLNRRQL